VNRLDIGKKLPKFKLPASGGASLTSDALLGRKLVLYFYPKDATAGCTLEAQDFRDHYAAFKKAGVAIVGVSRDSVKSHDNFCAKQKLPFVLISDTDEALCQRFDVIKEKSLYGRKYLGIERSTFLFDAQGVLRQAWRGVKVAGHAEAVLAAAKALPKT
jgi:peroxiredoxin Q/BCP